ncbi:dihydroorotate dehydrogenase [Methanocella paludicola SANAE]|uniref:Dihydroorotate dehydrogenase n=1 Tax=Methanocella paludicola (strain DSM 17711 / JCM 13418 / NBRC 101707 / SANAE) TaxID=304371 RepID=D1YYV3_METPS|nr:dihydroorotate dehydrogenase [Methanocella paludicola]BAI61625.1 dihydroorotate dehydrogenase [Methanocella paludicola SANAE]
MIKSLKNDTMKLTVEAGGLTLTNPTILAAGILGTTGASLKRVASMGAGAVVTKSIGAEPKYGHPNPSMIRLECGYINAMGLPNPSYKEFLPELETAKDSGVPVIASIFGATEAEFIEVAKGLPGASAYELNVSCPHARGYGMQVGTDPALVKAIAHAVKGTVNAPVWVKLTPNVTDITSIGRAAQEGGADAVVAINTLKAIAIDIDSGYPILGNIQGGLSGPAIKPVAVRCVYDLYSALDIPVIGAGGVSSWADAVEFIMAGAAAVEIGSAVYDDIGVFAAVSMGLSDYLDRKNMTLKDLTGMAHRMVKHEADKC